MKLTLALMDETDETRDLMQDADQMERMLGEFLAFARGDSLEETVPADPFALAAGVAENARRTGASVELVQVDENGGGAGAAAAGWRSPARCRTSSPMPPATAATSVLTVRTGPRWLTFVVEDDGPGIPEAERARALQPFTRLDAARPSDPAGPGVGLGLTIALDVARSHGGTPRARREPRPRRPQGDAAAAAIGERDSLEHQWLTATPSMHTSCTTHAQGMHVQCAAERKVNTLGPVRAHPVRRRAAGRGGSAARTGAPTSPTAIVPSRSTQAVRPRRPFAALR